MKIEVERDPLKDGEAWRREWSEKRNAAVAALVALKGDRERRYAADPAADDEFNDQQMVWFFWRYYQPEEERCQADLAYSPDARLYEYVTTCMEAARLHERERHGKAIAEGLKRLLGDDLFSALSDTIADERET